MHESKGRPPELDQLIDDLSAVIGADMDITADTDGDPVDELTDREREVLAGMTEEEREADEAAMMDALGGDVREEMRAIIDAAARGELVDEDLGALVLVDEASNRGAYRVRVVLEGFVYVDEPTWIDPAKVRAAIADDAEFVVSEEHGIRRARVAGVEVEPAKLVDLASAYGIFDGGLLRSAPFDPRCEWGAWTLGDLLAGYHRELPPARPSTLPELGRWILDPRQGERTRSGAHGWVLRSRQRVGQPLVPVDDVIFTNGQSALEVRGVDPDAVDDILPPVAGKRRDGDDEPGLEYEALASAMVAVADLRELALDGDASLESGEEPRKPVGDDGGPRVGLRFYEISAEPKVCARALGLWVVAPAEVAGDEQVLVEVLGKRFGGGLIRFTGNGWRAWLLGRGETVDDGPSLVVSIEPPQVAAEDGGRR